MWDIYLLLDSLWLFVSHTIGPADLHPSPASHFKILRIAAKNLKMKMERKGQEIFEIWCWFILWLLICRFVMWYNYGFPCAHREGLTCSLTSALDWDESLTSRPNCLSSRGRPLHIHRIRADFQSCSGVLKKVKISRWCSNLPKHVAKLNAFSGVNIQKWSRITTDETCEC